jgi:lysophospholipid acyltransferase (LPLAT)-like uncharacterized protein
VADGSPDRGGWKTAGLSLVAAGFIRALRATVRLRYHEAAGIRAAEREGRHFILAFWHRHLLLMPYGYRGRRISVLVSQSRDGELIARTVARLGIDSSRGSTTRGGMAGMRALLRKAGEGYDLAFTPDGPKGPASVVQPGVILAAMATGLPIQPVAMAASRCRRLRSWDRFVLPLPGARVHFVYGEPLAVPRRGGPDEAAEAAVELARRLGACETAALRLAENVLPTLDLKTG